MKPYILPSLFIILAAMSNAAMDKVNFHYSSSVFSELGKEEFYNPMLSWTIKWANDQEGNVLVGEEKFWGSSRWFVSLTDFWHLSKSMWIWCMSFAVVTYVRQGNWKVRVRDVIVFHLLYISVFHIFFHYII